MQGGARPPRRPAPAPTPSAVGRRQVGSVGRAEAAPARRIAKRIGETAISPDAIARGIRHALEQPSDVEVGSIVIRPTVQG